MDFEERGVMFCLRKKRFSGGARIIEEEVARKRYEQRERKRMRGFSFWTLRKKEEQRKEGDIFS